MTLLFRDSPAPGIEPLGPVLLGSIVRQALARVSGLETAKTEVQAEVWRRRREIAEPTMGAINEYAEIKDGCRHRWQAAELIRTIGGALRLYGWLGFLVTTGTALSSGYSFNNYWWPTPLLCVAASYAFRLVQMPCRTHLQRE
jgi:hypothetical protein